MTAWTDYVKEYSTAHGLTYKQAMSQASESYKKMKSGEGSIESIPPKRERKKRIKKVKADFVVDDQSGEGVIGDIVGRVKDVIFLRDDPAGSPSVRSSAGIPGFSILSSFRYSRPQQRRLPEVQLRSGQ